MVAADEVRLDPGREVIQELWGDVQDLHHRGMEIVGRYSYVVMLEQAATLLRCNQLAVDRARAGTMLNSMPCGGRSPTPCGRGRRAPDHPVAGSDQLSS